MLWIEGEFEVISPPDKLVYSWRVDTVPRSERVTVRFEPHPEGTEVIVVHERIADDVTLRTHEAGWLGCLDGLARFLES